MIYGYDDTSVITQCQAAEHSRSLSLTCRVIGTMYYIILGLGDSFNCSEHSLLYREVLQFSSMLDTQYFDVIKKKYFF